jgi:MFS family permease
MRHAIQQVRAFGPGVLPTLVSEALTWMGLLMGHIAVMWWVAERAGAGDLAIFGGAVAVISLLAAPWLSPLGDKYSKKTLRALSIAAFCGSSLGVCLMAWFDAYNLIGLIVLEGIGMAANCVFRPVSLNQLAELIPANKLAHGFSQQKSAQSLGRLAGPGVAGVLLASVGPAGTMGAQTMVLLVAALLACVGPRHAAAIGSRPNSRWWDDMKAGFKAACTVPLERNWTLIAFLSNLFLFPVLNMLVPLKIQSLGLNGSWFGGCEALLSIGMLVSALKGHEWLVEQLGRYRTRLLAGWLLTAALAGIALAGSGPALLLPFAVAGFANTTLMLVGLTHRTLACPTGIRSRMAAISGMSFDLAYILSPLLAGIALQAWAVDIVYLGFGIAGALLALSITWLPGMRQLLEVSTQDAEGWYSRVYPAAFDQSAGGSASDTRTGMVKT